MVGSPKHICITSHQILNLADLQKDDRELFAAVVAGNQRSFEVLFKKYYQALCSYGFQFMEEDMAAEEIVQELFCAIWEQRETIQIEAFKSYCYRAVRNKCLNALKHLKVREEYKSHNQYQNELEEIADDDDQTDERISKIQDAIEAMPTVRQKVFKMSRYEGLKYREIAEQLNISVKTVEIHMSKALGYLRTEMGKYITLIITLIHFYFKSK